MGIGRAAPSSPAPLALEAGEPALGTLGEPTEEKESELKLSCSVDAPFAERAGDLDAAFQLFGEAILTRGKR